jgi:hypothetical protein
MTLGAEVIPLQSLGVVDVGATDVADRDILANALANVSTADIKKGYAIRRGSQFVNEYPRTDSSGKRTDGGPDNPNHLLGAFPCLFPYGKGAVELDRAINVPYSDHVRRDLQYWDKRFRKDFHYIFQVFGVLQKRLVCTSAALQIKRKDFWKHEMALKSLTPTDLVKAAGEENRRVPFTNPVVRALRKHITSVRSKVMGTDESRVNIRSKIWSMVADIGPPSLWITVNPSDVGDPIAQVLAGVDIDLDNFRRNLGPDATSRSNTVAADPFAAAKFFHFVIDTMLEVLFGISADSRRGSVHRRPGIFGHVAAYIGTVEAQGRGTLHFHTVVWLKGAPTASRMKELLAKESFRRKVAEFIQSNIRSDIGGASARQIKEMTSQDSVSFARPVDPRGANYAVRSRESEMLLARSVQVHKCSTDTCLRTVKGQLVCKRNAPFDLATEDWIDEHGSWGSKRLYGYVNAWSPPILQTVRCNGDIKLITNGAETKNMGFYISNYVAKKQRESSNTSALLAKRVAFHRVQERYNVDICRRNKRLIQRCANTLSREQTFSSPEVISYLMGYGDRKISHHFVTLYTGDLYSALGKAFPFLVCDNR